MSQSEASASSSGTTGRPLGGALPTSFPLEVTSPSCPDATARLSNRSIFVQTWRRSIWVARAPDRQRLRDAPNVGSAFRFRGCESPLQGRARMSPSTRWSRLACQGFPCTNRRLPGPGRGTARRSSRCTPAPSPRDPCRRHKRRRGRWGQEGRTKAQVPVSGRGPIPQEVQPPTQNAADPPGTEEEYLLLDLSTRRGRSPGCPTAPDRCPTRRIEALAWSRRDSGLAHNGR